jgi:hypothetical protein
MYKKGLPLCTKGARRINIGHPRERLKVEVARGRFPMSLSEDDKQTTI